MRGLARSKSLQKHSHKDALFVFYDVINTVREPDAETIRTSLRFTGLVFVVNDLDVVQQFLENENKGSHCNTFYILENVNIYTRYFDNHKVINNTCVK